MDKNLAKLRAVREKLFTQKEMSEQLGISESYYCQLENGSRKLSLALAQKIVVILGMGLDDIFLP